MAFIYDMADTWNAAGTTFTAIKMNVTDTASNAASLLMDLQVGGVSQFTVSKAGRATVNDLNCASDLIIYRAGTAVARTGSTRFSIPSELGFSNNNPSSPDIFLARDAANTLAQRNGVNAQTFRVYNTFTDASNYERAILSWSGNDILIGSQAAGTGTNRQVHIRSTSTRVYVGSGTTTFAWDFTSASEFAGQAGSFMSLPEVTAPAAPAADRVRIYAEDNGAGKTRLMARFATGAAQQIAIEP
jgi:hypothetical protein